MKIATHNSATGECSRTWLHSLLTPFCRCQHKNIIEQYNNGCNYFDLRVRWIDNTWRLCHGLWQSSTSLTQVLDELTYLSFEREKPIVTIFYEGTFPSEYMRQAFLDDMEYYRKEYQQITFAIFGVKKPEWTNIVVHENIEVQSDFPMIIGWKALLPFPCFWNRFTLPHTFSDNHYTMIDFL